jgi:hypothetical protein
MRASVSSAMNQAYSTHDPKRARRLFFCCNQRLTSSMLKRQFLPTRKASNLMALDQPVDGGSMDAQVFGNLVHRHHLAPFRMARHLGATLPFHLKARESLTP